MTNISKEAVELHIQRCWMTDPEPDRTETLLRALSARVAELEAERDQITLDRLMRAKAEGRLQGLDEAKEAVGLVSIPIGQTKAIWDAMNAIEALNRGAGE